jgi:hypothetical protein
MPPRISFRFGVRHCDITGSVSITSTFFFNLNGTLHSAAIFKRRAGAAIPG